jgi:hypothetical protein
MTAKVICAIQARMNSKRLPGKVMADICGQPMIRRVWDACDGPWERKILTTLKRSDYPLCYYLDSQGMSYRRGSEDDVLSRYAELAMMKKVAVLSLLGLWASYGFSSRVARDEATRSELLASTLRDDTGTAVARLVLGAEGKRLTYQSRGTASAA